MSVSLEQTRYFVDQIVRVETQAVRDEVTRRLKNQFDGEREKLLQENKKLNNHLADMELEIRELKYKMALEVNQATEAKEMIMEATQKAERLVRDLQDSNSRELKHETIIRSLKEKYEGHLPKESSPDAPVKLMSEPTTHFFEYNSKEVTYLLDAHGNPCKLKYSNGGHIVGSDYARITEAILEYLKNHQSQLQ